MRTLKLVDRLRGSEQPPDAAGGVAHQGRLEAVVNGRAVGWAWCPDRAGERVTVVVLVDGTPACHGVADLARESLEREAIGDGAHGFDLPLPLGLAQSPRHTVEILAGVERARLVPSDGFQSMTEDPDHPFAGVLFTPVHRSAEAAGQRPSQRALLGRQGWLFLCQDRSLTLDQLAGIRGLSDEDVAAHIEAVVERRDRLSAAGIPYVFALAPMKERVYAELLPDGVAVRAPMRPVARLLRALRDVDGCELVDLLPALLDAKHHGQLYHRTDTHWNDRGAFFATRALLKEAAKHVPTVEPPRLDSLELIARPGFGGDLADKPKVTLVGSELLALVDHGDWSEDADVLDASGLRARPVTPEEHLHVSATRPPQAFEQPGPERGRCLLVGDSFCLMLLPWLAEQFSRLAFMWTPEVPLRAVEQEAPDVVLHIKAERFLLARPGTVAQATAGS